MIDFENIYNSYIEKQNESHVKKNKKPEGWFSASSVGSCLKRQYYKHIGTEPSDSIESQILRKMRLGTIMHKDMERAVNDYIDSNKEEWADKNYNIYTEYEVQIPELKVIGHLDYALVNDEKAEIYDLKTAHSYQYSLYAKKRGKTSQNLAYNMQVSTYGMAIASEHNIEDFNCYLLWYNKNDSNMNIKEVPFESRDHALYYWFDLNEIINNTEEPNQLKRGVDDGIPFEEWQCKHCEFRSICE